MAGSAGSLWNFDLFDFFSNLLPGVLVIGLFYSAFPSIFSGALSTDPLIFISTVAVIGYLLGHFIQFMSREVDIRLFERRKPFDERLTKEYGSGTVYEGVTQKFKQKAPQYFQLEIDWDKDNLNRELFDLFMVTRAYLTDNNVSPRVNRFHALYLLFQSTSLAFAIGSILYILLFVYRLDPASDLSWESITPLIISSILLSSSILSYYIRVQYHKRMARVMIYDFYTAVLKDYSP